MKFLLKYQIILDDNSIINDKEIKIDNCNNELHAKMRLEDYLKNKYINFKSLIVDSCTKQLPTGNFNDFFNNFGDIFGGGFKK